MNPYLKIKNEYKAALKKVAEYKIPSTTKFESLIDGVDVDAIKKSALITLYKKWSEFSSENIENLNADEIKERIWVSETKIIHEIDEAILKIKRLMPMVHDVIIPLRNVVNLIFQHGGIEECCGTDIKFHLTAPEVFESLSDLDDSISKLLIRRIDVKSPSTTERLLASYAVKDMETFCSVLNGDECDISEIERYFSLEMIQHASVFNESTIPEILKHFDESINDAFTGEQTNQIARESPRLILDILPDYLEIYNLLPDYLDFVIVLLSECSLTEEERSAIESILNRPEVVDLYNERRAAFEKKKNETQVDEQSQHSEMLQSLEENPNKTPDYNNIKEFVLPDNLMKFHSARQFSEFFMGYKLDAKELRAILDYLVKNSYITNDDQELLAFRLTGRMRPDGELHKIEWTCQKNPGSPKELYYLLRCTDDPDVYAKIKQFFSGLDWPDEKNEKYMARQASISFRRYLHNEIDPEVFTLNSGESD